MKKYNIIFIFLAAILIGGCEQYEDYKVDYKFSSFYFPYQKPLRTVVMGKGMDFEVGVVLGGRRDNQQKETVQYEIDTTLLDGTGLEPLPEDYYTLSNESQMVIPSGSINGRVTVELDSALFVDDTTSHEVTYALPFKITEASVDSVLRGDYNESTGSYEVGPKDYTIVAIKYINSYHGTYYHKGIEYVYDADDNPVDTNVFSFPNLINNFTWDLNTAGPNQLITTGIGGNHSGNYAMKLLLDGGNVRIENVDDSQSEITSVVGGSSSYDPEKQEFYLDYSYTDSDGMRHEAMDTLVFRDNGMEFETW